MFIYLQVDGGESPPSFLQNKCFNDSALSYPVQYGNITVNQGNYPHARSNAALLTDQTCFNQLNKGCIANGFSCC